jgi:two-component system NarL family sensor kinase
LKRIFTKLFLSYLAIGLASAVIISVIFYLIMRDALIERAYDQLSSINILKKGHIDAYLLQSRKNLEYLFARDIQPASGLSENLKSEINSIMEVNDFKSISLLDGDHDVVYSAGTPSISYKELIPKFGPRQPGELSYLIDVSHLTPSGTAMLYIIPATTGTMSFVVEENFQKIQALLNENTGMGQTGESYIVGSDMRLRSTSRFYPERPPRDISAYDFRADKAHVRPDYRGAQVVSVNRTLDHHGLEWTILSEIDLSEAMGPINELRNFLIATALALILITMAVTAAVSNAITKPVLYLRDVIISLSKGIIPPGFSMNRQDEIGEIARAIEQLIQGMHRTTQFAYAIGEGRFDTPFRKLSDKDALGEALIHMRDRLKSLTEKEVRLVREKAGAVLEGQENERKRITRELHDGVGQLLTVIRLRLLNVDGNADIVNEIKTLLKETVDEVKRISFNVMPNTLVDFGLEAALDALCRQVRKAGHIAVDFQYIREVDRPLSFDVSTAVYRIAQEGLNNILKHAHATEVNLHVIDKEDEIFLLLEDNGKGFIPDNRKNTQSGFGLRSMRERARLLNGNVEVHSDQGAGTIIEVHIPIVGEFEFKL